MDKGLTPYLLAIAPIIMFIGFSLGPDTEDLQGQAYLDEIKKVDANMMALTTVVIIVGIVSTIGSFFLLSQDMMSNVGKTQQDMLMLARVAFVVPLVCFTIGAGAQAEAYWLLTEDPEGMTADEADDLAMDLHRISNHIWGAMPIGLGFALALAGTAGLMGKDLAPNANTFGFGFPLIIGIGLLTVFWTEAWIFFFVAMFAGMPLGIMMLMKKLEI